MRIKLDGDILAASKELNFIDGELAQHLSAQGERREKFWDAIKDKFKGLNMISARIEHDTGDLVLPFEEERGRKEMTIKEMTIKEITYGRVKSIPGKYETERLEMTASVDEDEKIERAYETLRETVNNLLYKE